MTWGEVIKKEILKQIAHGDGAGNWNISPYGKDKNKVILVITSGKRYRFFIGQDLDED